MRPLARLAGLAALLLLAAPLCASLPGDTSWSLPGTVKVMASTAFGSRTVRSPDILELQLDGAGGFSYHYASDPGFVFRGTLQEEGKWTLLVLDQESMEAYRDAVVEGLGAEGIEVLDFGDPRWDLRAKARERRGEAEMRVKILLRTRMTVYYAGRDLRLGLVMRGGFRGGEAGA